MSVSDVEVVRVDRAADMPEAVWTRFFATPRGGWWYRALDESGLDDQFSLRYLLLKRDGVMVGLVPTFVMDVPMRSVVPPELLPWVTALGQVKGAAHDVRRLAMLGRWLDQPVPGHRYSDAVANHRYVASHRDGASAREHTGVEGLRFRMG